MKYPKMLGLAAIAALALVAMVGASNASAKLCSKGVAGSGCGGSAGHGEVYTGTLAASLESGFHATLTTGFVNVTCKKTTLGGSVADGASTPATGSITSLTFGECPDNVGGTCSVTSTASATNPWPVVARTGTSPNGFIELSNVTIQFICGQAICKYESPKVGTKNEITVTGGAPATVKATSVPLAGEASNTFPCSATAVWHWTHIVTAPSSLYLT